MARRMTHHSRVFFPMLTGNYYAIDRAAQHEACVHSRARTSPSGKDRLTPRRKRSIKAAADDMFYTTYETLGGVFDCREGEYHERIMADT